MLQRLSLNTADKHISKFRNADTIISEAKSIVHRANEADLFTLTRPSNQIVKSVISDAKNWVLEVEDNIEKYSARDALIIAGGLYDLIHRIGFNRPSKPEFINVYVLKALDAFIKGDKTVDEYDLFRAIDAGLNRKDNAYSSKALQWHSLCLSRWYRQFKNGSSLEQLSDYDKQQQLSILIISDLYAFEGNGQDEFKRQLITNHKPLLEKPATPQTALLGL